MDLWPRLTVEERQALESLFGHRGPRILEADRRLYNFLRDRVIWRIYPGLALRLGRQKALDQLGQDFLMTPNNVRMILRRQGDLEQLHRQEEGSSLPPLDGGPRRKRARRVTESGKVPGRIEKASHWIP